MIKKSEKVNESQIDFLKLCPKCGKAMILCEDERTYHQIWECDGCGYKEDE